MTRWYIAIILALSLALSASNAFGQVPTGTPPLSTVQATPEEAINLASLNVHLAIPIREKAGRGLPFSYKLSYDNSIWYPTLVNGTQTWQPTTAWGWSMGDQPTTGYLSFYTFTSYCYTGRVPTGDRISERSWTYHDPLGTSHPFPGAILVLTGTCGSSTGSLTNDAASDGSGYSLTAIPSTQTYQVTSIDGTVFTPPVNEQTNSGGSVVDSNGNEITTNGSTFTDTLGTTALTFSGSGTPSSPYVYSYQGPSQSAPYTVNYTAYTVKTNFGCSGVAEFGPTTENLVSSIALPDGNKYTFTYEQTPGYSGDVTGRLASISIPTGGTIAYAYTGANNGIDCSDGSAAGLTRTVNPGGTWTYSRSNSFSTTTVTDPQNNQTVIVFQGGYETQRQVYNGSSSGTPVETVETCYNGATPPCTGDTVSFPVTQRTIYTTWSSGQESETNLDYDYNSGTGLNAVSLVIEADDYGYGSGQPGPLSRKTVTNYASLTGIWDRPSSISVYNGSGGLVAQTNYSYDQTGVVGTSGTPQHIAPLGSRGNPTAISRLVQGSTYVNETVSYFDTGNVYQATDPNGNVTTYSYGSSGGCGNSFLTSVTFPLSLGRSMNWDCNGGVVTSVTDLNNNQTTFAYNTSNDYFWRLTDITYPDSGWKLIQYPSLTETDTYTGIADSTPSVNCNSCRHDQTIFDGLGRLSQRSLVNDPDGETAVTTSYDSDGRVYQVTNPERSGLTWAAVNGTTTTSYDGLGRPTTVTQPDGSGSHIFYGSDVSGNGGTSAQLCSTSTYGIGYPTLTVDASGLKREVWLDALGRTIEVDEPDSSNNLTQATCDAYDANGNLLDVVSPTGQARSYSYDGLGRVTSATTPESGATTYTYDANGNLISRTDARNITATYSYDALNRLTSISYSDGTPEVVYTYDASSEWGVTLTNTAGRLVAANSNGAGTIFSYDPMGRVVNEWECTPLNCGTGSFPLAYTYDLLGDLTSETNGEGVQISYSYSPIGEVTGVSSSLQDANHPGTLATVDPTAGYWPNGALRKLTLGNGLTETMAYNDDLQPCRMNVNSSGTAYSTCTDPVPSGNVQDYTYGYNAGGADNGDVMSWSATGTQNFNRSYTYDPLNRLATMSSPSDPDGCYGLSWTYDALGNRIAQNATSGTCQTFSATVNANNQLVGPPYQYDASGNLTNDGAHTYTYDAEDRITQVDGGATAAYLYDALGHRFRKTVSGVNTDYIYDAFGRVVAEVGAGCGTNCFYAGHVYMGNSYLVEYRDSTTYFIQPDQLGSTRVMTKPDQSLFDSMDFYPFGEQAAGGTGTTHKFTSQESDGETDLYHFPARYYAPTLGRFMSPDPLQGDVLDPQSLNRYAYVMDNPTNWIDPLGLVTLPSCGTNTVTCVQVLSGPLPIFPIVDLFGDGGLTGLTGVGVGGPVEPGSLRPRGGGGGSHSPRPTPQTPQTQGKNGCLVTVFDPSCKPKGPPSCPSVFVNGTLNALSNGGPVFPPGENPDDLIRAGGGAWAATYVMEKGLIVPLRSSVVRNFLGDAEFFAEMTVFAPLIYSETQGLKREVSDWSSGACSTLWTKP